MDTSQFNAGGNPAMDLHSIYGGEEVFPSRFILQKPEISTGLIDQLARMQTLPLL